MRGFMKKMGAVAVGVVASVSSAFAALPAVVGTTITSVQTDALALADLVWPFLLTLLGVVLLMKYAKRFIGKA